MIFISDYDPNWPIVFESLRSPIACALAGIAIAVEQWRQCGPDAFRPALERVLIIAELGNKAIAGVRRFGA
jgi:hypothetical protein